MRNALIMIKVRTQAGVPIMTRHDAAAPIPQRVALTETTPMCLAIPMQIVEIDGLNARCEAKGIERTVSLFLLQHETVEPGDMVLIHVGYAIQKVSAAQARSAWELFDEMLAADALVREAQRA